MLLPLAEAIARHGRPATLTVRRRQGSLVISSALVMALNNAEYPNLIRRPRPVDGQIASALCRIGDVVLKVFEPDCEAGEGIGAWIDYYSRCSSLSAFGYRAAYGT